MESFPNTGLTIITIILAALHLGVLVPGPRDCTRWQIGMASDARNGIAAMIYFVPNLRPSSG